MYKVYAVSYAYRCSCKNSISVPVSSMDRTVTWGTAGGSVTPSPCQQTLSSAHHRTHTSCEQWKYICWALQTWTMGSAKDTVYCASEWMTHWESTNCFVTSTTCNRSTRHWDKGAHTYVSSVLLVSASLVGGASAVVGGSLTERLVWSISLLPSPSSFIQRKQSEDFHFWT